MYNSLSNNNFNIKKIISGHICYSNTNFVPYPPQTQNLVRIKTCQIIIIINCYLKETCNTYTIHRFFNLKYLKVFPVSTAAVPGTVH